MLIVIRISVLFIICPLILIARFVQYNKTCHGMVLLNYTARSGTVGQRVLLDASEYEDEQTIVLFVLPRVTKPELTLEGDYSVDEDSFENKFLVSTTKLRKEQDLSLNKRNHSHVVYYNYYML